MKKILVIDDEQAIRLSTAKMLRKFGYEVLEAVDGRNGLELARDRLPDLVLSDIMMKDVDGFDVVQGLRSEPATAAIPIILMTGNGDDKKMRHGMELGADDYLPKPFTLKALCEAVRVRLERKYNIQEQVKENEARLLEILAATPDLVAVVDAETSRLTYLNCAGRRMLGLGDLEDISRLRLEDFELDRQANGNGNGHLPETRTQSIWTGESTFLSRDGRRVSVVKQVLAHYSSSRQATHLSVVASDITERKRMDQALRGSETRYRELVNCQGEGVIYADAELRFTFANPAAESLFGVWPGQLVGKKLEEFLDEKNRLILQEQMKQRQAGNKSSYELEIIVARGERRQILITGTPQMDSEGGFCGTFAIFRDITQRKQAERAMRENQRLLKAILDNIPDPAWLKDAQGRYQVGNKSLARIYKCQVEEILGKTVFEVFPKHAAGLVQGDQQVASSGKTVRSEDCIPDADGHNRWFDTIETPIFNEKNEVAGTAGIARDITEHRQVEAALRESEAQLHAMFDLASIGIAQADPRTGKWLRVNEKLCAITGYSAGELLEKCFSEITHPDDRQPDWEVFQRVVRGEAKEYRMDKRYLRKDGTVIWVNVNVTIIRDAGGQPTRSVATIEDITERKRADDTLKEQLALRERLAKIAANVPGIIYAFRLRPDGSSCLPYASPTIESFCGALAEDLVNDSSPLFNLIHPDDQAPMRESIAESARTMLPWRKEFRLRHPKTGWFWAEGRSTPEREADGGTLWHGFMSDITERKRVDEALAERARLAALEAEVGAVLTRSGTLSEVLRQCGEVILRHLDGTFVRIWALNEPGKMLELQASVGLYTHLDGPHGRIPVGKFKIGLIAAERKPHLTNQVVGDPCVGDQEWAKREGMVAFAGYPLLVENRLVGVVAMFARHALTDMTLQALASVSRNIAAGMDRKRFEEALLESKRFLHSSLNALSSHIAILDEHGTIVEVNAAWNRFAQQNGFANNYGVGKNYLDVCGSATGDCSEEAPRVAAGIRDVIAGKSEQFYLEYPCHSPEQERWFLMRATRFSGAESVRVVVAHENITERVASENQVERLRSEYAGILNSLGEGVHWIDTDGRIKFENPAAAKMLGYETDELIGKPAHETMHHKRADGTDYPKSECGIYATLRDGKIRRVTDEVFWRKDGASFAVEYTCTPVYERSGRSGGAVVIFNDIAERKRTEEKLHLQSSALAATANGIAITDCKGQILWVNAAFAKLTGYGAEEVIGKTPAVLKSGVHDQPFYEGMWKTILAGKVWHGELVNRRKDGSLYHEEMTITPVRNEAGEIQHFVAVKQDVSARTQFEKDLARERDLLQALMDNLPDHIYFKDTQSRFTRINRALARHFSLQSPEEAIGKSDADYFPTRFSRQKLADEQCIIASGKPLLGLVEESDTARGKCWVSSTKVPIRGDDGQITGLVGISRDITQRALAEEEIRAQKESFRALTDNVPDGIARIDCDLRFVYVNRVLASNLGLTAEKMLGKTNVELSLPAMGKWSTAIQHVFQTGKTETFDFQSETPAGTLFFETRLMPEHASAGGVQYVLLLARDVTEQKNSERQQQLTELQLRQAQKLEAVGQLAAGIAHEINTPTQYVGDNTRFLKDTFSTLMVLLRNHGELLAAAQQNTLTPELLKQLEETLKASDLEYLSQQIPQAIQETLEGVDRVTKIVRAMKEFSHPGGKEKAAADLNKAIESTTTVARNEWKYVSDLKLDLDPKLPLVPCFIGEFNQCILNLVVNAAHAIGDVVKQNPGAKGLITIQTRRIDDQVEVRVSDTGTGIAEIHRGKIFEPFFTTKDVGKGTGQGLHLIYSTIVKKHGGAATFETEVGHGTTFILRLPIHPKNPTTENPAEAPAKNPPHA